MQSIATSGASAPSFALREHSAQLTVEHIPITLIDQGSGTPTLLLHGTVQLGRYLERRSRALARALPLAGARSARLRQFGRAGRL